MARILENLNIYTGFTEKLLKLENSHGTMKNTVMFYTKTDI